MKEKELSFLFTLTNFREKKSFVSYILSEQHTQSKQLLAKYKEDVEQAELFGMERQDYDEKKNACVDLIVKLREIEKTQNSLKEVETEKDLFELITDKKFAELTTDKPTDEQYEAIRYNVYESAIVKEHYLVNKEIVEDEKPDDKPGCIIVPVTVVKPTTIVHTYEYKPKPIIYAKPPEPKDGYILIATYREEDAEIIEEWQYELIQEGVEYAE